MNARVPDEALPFTLDPEALQAFVNEKWDREIIPALTDHIEVPAKSPAFDPDWKKKRLYRTGSARCGAMSRSSESSRSEAGNYALAGPYARHLF